MSDCQQPATRAELAQYEYRIIVAGTRDYSDYSFFSKGMFEYIARFPEPTVQTVIFITGAAKSGADDLIIRWCKEHGYRWAEFPALWDDIDVPLAVVRYRRDGKPYNVRAGFFRNTEMAKVGTNLMVWWDGISKGTKHMLSEAARYKLIIETILIDVTPRD